MVSRKNEQDATHFRSERIVSINGQWFFQTRDRETPYGPFPTREQTQKALNLYVATMQTGKSRYEAEVHMQKLSDDFKGDRY